MKEYSNQIPLNRKSALSKWWALFCPVLLRLYGRGTRKLSQTQHFSCFFSHVCLKLIHLFIYVWLCWVYVAAGKPSLVAASWGHSLAGVHGLFTVVAFLLQSTSSRECRLQKLSSHGNAGFRSSVVMGIQASEAQ